MKRYDYRYLIREGIASIFVHGFMSFAAVSVIVACLILMGSFVILSLNVESLISKVEGTNEMLAYVDETFSIDQAKALEANIEALDNIKSVTFIDRDQALEDYKETLGNEGELLDGLDEDNPLRDRYRITLKDVEFTEQTADQIKAIDGIAEVKARVDLANGFVTARNMINFVLVSLIVVLFAVSIFIISNTIKLSTFDRREEIAIMKMVGATNGFIRWPFVIQGMILGLLGAAVAYFAQWGIYAYVADRVLEEFNILTLVSFEQVSPTVAIIFLATGLVVGVGGSVMTIRRFLRV